MYRLKVCDLVHEMYVKVAKNETSTAVYGTVLCAQREGRESLSKCRVSLAVACRLLAPQQFSDQCEFAVDSFSCTVLRISGDGPGGGAAQCCVEYSRRNIVAILLGKSPKVIWLSSSSKGVSRCVLQNLLQSISPG